MCLNEIYLSVLRNKSLEQEPTDTYEICEIYFWEDDGVQFRDPDYEGGANKVSLRQAQKNFLQFGACEEGYFGFPKKMTNQYVKDLEWKPFLENK